MTHNSPNFTSSSSNNGIFTFSYSTYTNYVYSGSGGVFHITSAISIQFSLILCLFVKCSCTTNGGVLYSTNQNSQFFFSKCCCYDLQSRSGTFSFNQASSQYSFSKIDFFSVTKSYATPENVLYFYYFSSNSSNINATGCSASTHNFFYHNDCQYSFSKFHNYIENSLDILYCSNNPSGIHEFSQSNIIKNHQSRGLYGFLHTNIYSTSYLFVYNAIFQDNTHTLINVLDGKITIINCFADEFLTTATPPTTNNIIITKTNTYYIKLHYTTICQGMSPISYIPLFSFPKFLYHLPLNHIIFIST
jgi:hypothetical protein